MRGYYLTAILPIMKASLSPQPIRKWLFILLVGVTPGILWGQDSVFLSPEKRVEEIDFIIRQIDSVYVFGRRGISDDEWNRRLGIIRGKIDSAENWNEYRYALRYFGMLISDGHFTFPHRTYYNRMRIFQKTDTLFPVWIKTWKDGTVYVQEDYTGHIPRNAKILRINGRSAQEMMLSLLSMACWETDGQVYYGPEDANSSSWYNLMNFLFMEGYSAPYHVEYTLPESERIDTVVLEGMTRQEIHTANKKIQPRAKGDNIWNLLFGGKTITTQKLGDHSAVMTINYFWGENALAMIFGHKDKRYPRKLKKAMAWVDRHKIDTLILDISNNPGGLTDNVYITLNYLTEKTVDANRAYRVNDGNREKIKTVIQNTPYEQLFGLSAEQTQQMESCVDSVRSGDYLTTDMVCDVRFRPNPDLKHRYRGKAYLLTSEATYSAAQLFAQYFKTLGIGPTVGRPCGGYASISGGNCQSVKLPYTNRFTLSIPYTSLRNDVHSPRFEYDSVDILIPREELTCDEWLAGKKVEKLRDQALRRFKEGTL